MNRFERLATDADRLDDDAAMCVVVRLLGARLDADALTLDLDIEWRGLDAAPPGLPGRCEVRCEGVLAHRLELGEVAFPEVRDDDPRIWRRYEPRIEVYVHGRAADPVATARRVAAADRACGADGDTGCLSGEAGARQVAQGGPSARNQLEPERHRGPPDLRAARRSVALLEQGFGLLGAVPARAVGAVVAALAADGIEVATLPERRPAFGPVRLVDFSSDEREAWVIAQSFAARDVGG